MNNVKTKGNGDVKDNRSINLTTNGNTNTNIGAISIDQGDNRNNTNITEIEQTTNVENNGGNYKIIIGITIVVLAALCYFALRSNPAVDILGTWATESESERYTFFEDGTYENERGDLGKYVLLKDSKIKMTDFYLRMDSFTYSLQGNTLELTSSGSDYTKVFHKIKD